MSSQAAAAVIVAGGKGIRFGGRIRKQYLLLAGRPVLWWSLNAFRKTPSIRAIVLVVPEPDLSRVQALVNSWKIGKWTRVVAGGNTRAESVREGLKAVPPFARWVAVHDAVRPLVTPKLIEQTLRAARRHGAAIAAAPSHDSVKMANGDGCIHASLPRESVWLAQTPQIFERRLLERAHGLAPGSGVRRRGAVTDDAQLVERLGVKVRLVEAPRGNIKITMPADLKVAQLLMKGQN